jgi:hypothetical protein
MIYLKNSTKYSNKAILKVLRYAERKIGVEGNTYIEVKPAQHYYGSRGMANRSWKYDFGKFKKIQFGYGWIEIWIPTYIRKDIGYDELSLADSFLDISLHELAHVKDYRTGRYFNEPKTKSGRRIAHDKRPCEVSSYNQVYDARKLTRKNQLSKEQKIIFDFALEIERTMKED